MKPHKKASIRDDIAASTASKGWNISVRTQSPRNSPNLNVLELGFFNLIQSLQYKKCSNDIDHLIMNTGEKAFDDGVNKKL